MKIVYAINDFQFVSGSRKIYVKNSKGIMDLPKPKEPFKVNYPFRDGEEVYLGVGNKMSFEPRIIELECVIVSPSVAQLYLDFSALKKALSETTAKKLKRLYIQIDTGYYPLVYDVYLADEITLQKRFSDGEIAGTFTLKLCEPNPMKLVYQMTDYSFIVGASHPNNLITDSFINATISSSAGLVSRTVSVTANNTYTFSSYGNKLNTKNGQVIIHNANSSFSRTLLFTSAVPSIQSVTFTAPNSETLYIDSTCVPQGGGDYFFNKWHMLSLGTAAATMWKPTSTEPVKLTITFRNPTSKKQVINVLLDGKAAASQSTIIMASGAVNALAEFTVTYQCEYINGFLNNPVISIDNNEVEIYGSSKTLLKAYTL